jgi:hypothetical protein
MKVLRTQSNFSRLLLGVLMLLLCITFSHSQRTVSEMNTLISRTKLGCLQNSLGLFQICSKNLNDLAYKKQFLVKRTSSVPPRGQLSLTEEAQYFSEGERNIDHIV